MYSIDKDEAGNGMIYSLKCLSEENKQGCIADHSTNNIYEQAAGKCLDGIDWRSPLFFLPLDV